MKGKGRWPSSGPRVALLVVVAVTLLCFWCTTAASVDPLFDLPYRRQLPDCGQFTNCSTCTRKGGCGWCLRPTSDNLVNGSCVAGENSGPSNPETCSRWFYQDCHNIDLCEATDCHNCTALTGCGWCASSEFCLPGNSTSPDPEQGAVCAKPYWIWGSNKCSVPAVSPSSSASPSPSASASASASPSPSNVTSPSPSASVTASTTPSPSSSPTSSPSASTSPIVWPSPTVVDQCPGFTNCSSCVAGSKCLWCLESQACFNSTKSVNPCKGYYTNTCLDEYCANFTTCDECSSQPICGWCNYTKCVASERSQPTYAKCTAWQYRTCAPIPCDAFRDCNVCTQPGNDYCAWCDPSARCLPIINPPPQPGDPSCPYNWFWKECPAPIDCARYSGNCKDCTSMNPYCYWCTSTDSPKSTLCSNTPRSGYACSQISSQCPAAPSNSPTGGGSGGGLSGGAIAGIVIGSLVGVAIIPAALFVWYGYYWRNRHYYMTLE